MLPKYPASYTIAFTTVTLAFSLFLITPRPVHAQSADGALVLHDCPTTSTFYGQTDGYTYQVCADIVFTPSGDVNATFHGALLDPTTAPSQPVISTDFPCAYNGQTSNESHVVITTDGSVNGSCQLHAK